MLAIEALDGIELQKGAHASREKGVCAMELAAWIAGEPHSDHPACVSAALGALLRNWNDSVDHKFRQKLKPYIPRVVGTGADGRSIARAWMAADWLVRVCAPAWLELAKLKEHAMALRTAEVIRDSASCARVQPLLEAARVAAGDAAMVAAWEAAREAAWDAWAAASAAASAAARDAASSALKPTVELLQASAFELLDRMIAGGE